MSDGSLSIGDYIDWQLREKEEGRLNSGVALELAYVDRIFAMKQKLATISEKLAHRCVDIAHMAQLLRGIQWECDPESNYCGCGFCGNREDEGHSHSCEIGRILRGSGDKL